MEKVTFKERVKNKAIEEARNYKEIYLNYEYLICSSAFRLKDYYIINAKEDNYQHLIGVNSKIKPKLFFEKCYNGELEEDDFDFIKERQSEKSVIGSVRRKINVLSNMMKLFYTSNEIKVEESFVKNQIFCSFATSDDKCTLGFIDNTKSRPKTLVKGNELDKSKMADVDLVLRKETGADKFNEIIIGDTIVLNVYYDKIKNEIGRDLLDLIIKSKDIEEVAVEVISNNETDNSEIENDEVAIESREDNEINVSVEENNESDIETSENQEVIKNK